MFTCCSLKMKLPLYQMLNTMLYVIIGIALIWMVASVITQYTGNGEVVETGSEYHTEKALIVYNPDPYYNFDFQICKSFADGLLNENISSTICTTKNLQADDYHHYNLYVFCANTYNFAPDWEVVKAINKPSLKNENVVALTVGAGRTKRAKSKLEQLLKSKSANLLDSKAYWLLRPNDADRIKENNVQIANEKANRFGREIGKIISKTKKYQQLENI